MGDAQVHGSHKRKPPRRLNPMDIVRMKRSKTGHASPINRMIQLKRFQHYQNDALVMRPERLIGHQCERKTDLTMKVMIQPFVPRPSILGRSSLRKKRVPKLLTKSQVRETQIR